MKFCQNILNSIKLTVKGIMIVLQYTKSVTSLDKLYEIITYTGFWKRDFSNLQLCIFYGNFRIYRLVILQIRTIQDFNDILFKIFSFIYFVNTRNSASSIVCFVLKIAAYF